MLDVLGKLIQYIQLGFKGRRMGDQSESLRPSWRKSEGEIW